MTAEPLHIVLDDTAVVAAGKGNALASRLVHRAHVEAGWFLHAPARVQIAADRVRPGTSPRSPESPSWNWTCPPRSPWPARPPGPRPTPGTPPSRRPSGAVIATTAPETWKGQPVRLLDLGP